MKKHGPSPRAGQNEARPATKYGPKPKPIEERFWSKVSKLEGADACWLWTAALNGKNGYGMLYDADVGDKMLAHRVAWKVAYGSYPEGVVRHICDNPACVRIDHLVEGTQAENMKEMAARGRAKNQLGKYCLTFETAEEIRAIYKQGNTSQEALAQLYGVDQTTVSRVILGKRHTTPTQERTHKKAVPPKKEIKRKTVEERFWAKVDKDGPLPEQEELGQCWIWTAAKTGQKHELRGSFRRTHRRAEGAHRVAWELGNGPIPAGLVVCHRCDVGLCVRPSHLFVATQAENMEDMRKKGRGKFFWSRSERELDAS